MRAKVLLVVVAMAAAGCSVRAPYKAPQPAPVALGSAAQPAFSPAAYDGHWWRQFDDPVLDQLQDAAQAANPDVRIALARVDQSRAVFSEVRLDQFPTATVGASIDRREQVVPGFTDAPVKTSTYRAAFDAFWEIDVFGRVRSAVRSASADAQAFAADLAASRVIVAAEVARNYFELRGLQQQLAVADRSLANQRESLRLTTVRRDAGIGEEQDVASAAARVSATEASVPPLRVALAERVNRLAVLTGVRPGQLHVDLSPRAYPPLAKALSIGDAAHLLDHRPDVRAAERRLAASTAREGVAAADLYPRVSVSGILGILAGRGSVFGKADSRAWAVTPAVSWAGLDIGRPRARLRGAEAATREALASYEQTMLRAVEETDNALVLYREQQERLVKLGDQARESTRAANIARVRYREGATDFLELLDAERSQLAAEDALAQAESGVFTSVVAVYKALGGI